MEKIPVTAIFEHGEAYAESVRNAFSPRFLKSYTRKLGKFIKLSLEWPQSVDRDCPFEQYTYYKTAPRRVNYERRVKLKAMLGRGFAVYVKVANKSTKAQFTGSYLEDTMPRYEQFMTRIRTLGFKSKGHFWQVVKGTKGIPGYQ